ncbi:NACHT, LRR and PYD domains-containing protein 5-like [Pristis pectinata]|uniref:NACHT, LRR and PYD domains-containing protein 5-like n=1 Tax=Pristis pectinata TaxID=685728 RepID=UPI00223D627C|nr:NACHT, LRR and PYD domains-containing protein 5-like [Pristis pectinata]
MDYTSKWMLLSCVLLRELELGVGSFSRSYGILNKDILLPCTFPVTTSLDLNNLVITWQRTDTLTVVCTFYSGSDQPKHQDAAYRGRSQLFQSEFPKGNASLKLKSVSLSDVGNYTCFVFGDEEAAHIENIVELRLLDVLQFNGTDVTDAASERQRYGLKSVVLLGSIAAGILIWQMKRKKQPDLEEKTCLLEDRAKAAIQNYKDYILKDQARSCCTVLRRRLKNNSLSRSINVTSSEEWDPDSDLIRKGYSNIVKDSQLLSFLQKKSLKRVLLVGDAGVGKSWAVDSLEQEWASQLSHRLNCVIVLRFSDLNEVKGKTTLRELLKKQCKPLSSVLTELLQNPQDVLIILDGLDEFSHQLKWDTSGCDLNLDSVAEVNVLVSKLISGNLLRGAQVLVTSRWNTKQIEFNKKYFDRLFIISGFTNNELKGYCSMFYGEEEKAAEIYQQITKNDTIKCLASNPLNSYLLCTIFDRHDCCSSVNTSTPMTNSKVFSLLLYSLFNCSTCKTIVVNKTELEHELLKVTILKVGELSFNTLLSGRLEMNAVDLNAYKIDQCLLSKYLSNHVLEKKCNDQSPFKFYHVVLKEQFAALYCAASLNDDVEELVKCLDLWCFGKKPQNQMSQFYLQSFRPDQTEKLYNFTRLFMGSLTAGRDGKLWNYTTPLAPSTARALITWFKNSLERDIKKAELLNLMHCLFELHDPTVTAEVSPCIKSVEFLNVSLSPLDLSALRYCLSHSTVEKLDLRLCGIGDEGIKQLKDVLLKCKTLLVSSNKLTEESAEILSCVLQDPKCRIETLSSGTNSFGSMGAQFLWKALARNKSLKILRLYDNGITDEGTEDMIQYLTFNTILQKLFLCANELGDVGQRNIQQVEKSCNRLKIITKIKDDEELLLRVETQLEELLSCSQEYDEEWLQRLMKSILKDLGDESCIPDQKTCVRVGKIKATINKILQKNKRVIIDVPSQGVEYP